MRCPSNHRYQLWMATPLEAASWGRVLLEVSLEQYHFLRSLAVPRCSDPLLRVALPTWLQLSSAVLHRR